MHEIRSKVSANHWTCLVCDTYNDILRTRCHYCNVEKPYYVTGYSQGLVEVRRDIWRHYGFEELMTEHEKLFADWYNAGKILVSAMSIDELRSHREKLALIILEGKANAQAADDEVREREKKAGKNRELLTTNENVQTTSDAINAVKTRQARMTKADKLKKQLESQVHKDGTRMFDDATIAMMIGNIEKKATDSDMKTVTFKSPTVEDKVVVVKIKKDDDATPFDPSSLIFK